MSDLAIFDSFVRQGGIFLCDTYYYFQLTGVVPITLKQKELSWEKKTIKNAAISLKRKANAARAALSAIPLIPVKKIRRKRKNSQPICMQDNCR